MITDRTLYAYEQFCENYYDDFSIASRARRRTSESTAEVSNKGNTNDRNTNLELAADIGSKSRKHASAGFPTYHNGAITEYTVPVRVANKISIKRDPYYKDIVIKAKEARRQYHSPETIAERKADRAAKKRIEKIAKKIGDWDKEYDEYV